jgi:hypothetical protein
MIQPTAVSNADILPVAVANPGTLLNVNEQTSDQNSIPITIATIIPQTTSQSSGPGLTRKSTRTKTTRDILKPKLQGKAYTIGKQRVYNFKEQRVPTWYSEMGESWYLRPMPKSTLLPVFRAWPLNLNADGTKISYKNRMPDNSYKIYWEQADAVEIIRLLISSTIRPLHFRDIPLDQVVTYVNPVCMEKLNDGSSLKFCTASSARTTNLP